MDVIATAQTENTTEKKKRKNQKVKERTRKKTLSNQTNQNVEISGNEKCHGIAEADSHVGPVVDLEESSQVDRAPAEKIREKTKIRESNKTRKGSYINQNNEISSNEKCDAIAKRSSYVGLAVGSPLRGLSLEDKVSNDAIENKRTAFGDELVLDVSKEERVLGEAVKENSRNETQKRERKSKRRGVFKTELELMDEAHGGLDISKNVKSCIAAEASEVGLGVDIISKLKESRNVNSILTTVDKEKIELREKRKRCNSKSTATNKDRHVICDQENKCLETSVDSKCCIAATVSGINGVDSVKSLLQDLPEIEEVSTKIAKENKTLKEKQKEKKKSMARDKDGNTILDKENKCLKISVDRRSCISAPQSCIKGEVTLEPPLQESPEVEELTTNILNKQKTLEEKQRMKTASYYRDNNVKVILGDECKSLKISVDRSNCIAASDIVNNQKNPEEKRRSKIESYYKDNNVKVILGEEDECMEISADRKCCIGASDIVKNQKTPEAKRRRKIESYYRDNNVKMTFGEEDKCLKISADGKCCIAASDIVKNQKTAEEEQRRKIESYYRDNNVKVILGEEDKCLKISADRKCFIESFDIVKNQKTPEEKQRRKIESYNRDNNVKVILSEEDKCLIKSDAGKCFVAAYDIVKNQKTPEEKLRRKVESYYRDNNVKVIFREEDKCPKISDGKKSCIAASVSAIKDIGPHVESLLQDSPVVDEATTEIVKGKKRSEGKQKQKIKLTSRTKDKVEVPITDRQDELLVTTTNGKCGTKSASVSAIEDIGLHVEPLLQDSPVIDEATTEIFKGKKSSEEKQKQETELTSSTKNKIEVQFIDQQDEVLVTTTNGKCGTKAASVSAIEDIGPHVEPLQDSPVVDEATTEIDKGKTSSEGKQRQKTKLTSRSKNKVEVPIIDQQDKLVVTTTSGKCGTKTEIGKLHCVDTRSKFHVGNVSSLASSEIDDLPNYFDERPQRELTTCSRKILVVLDINGLLADIVAPPPKERKSDINIYRRAIFKRPYCDDFLNFCFDTFDVGIWSSRTKRILDRVVDYLLGERKHKLLFCWDHSHTTISNFKTLENKGKPLVCKDLSNLWAKRDPALPWEKGYYTESNTLLIDDSPYKALLNPMHTTIFPNSFAYNDQHDNSIGPGGELRVYLQNLAKTDDVRKYVEEHPFGQCPITEKSSSWDFYSKVINSLSKYS